MTRQDYIQIARALADVRPSAAIPGRWLQWHADTEAIAGVLHSDNLNFDHERFMNACMA